MPLHGGGTETFVTDKELRKLNRRQLLELLLEQTNENKRLTEENDSLRQRLEKKEIILENAGSIAEAALMLNEVFDAAQAAVDQYIKSIKKMYGSPEVRKENKND